VSVEHQGFAKKSPISSSDAGIYISCCIIPDLCEVGVNVLNPQFSCHRLESLAETAKGRLCVSSDVDRQYILPRGTPAEVDSYVKKVVELFGRGNNGGLIGRGEVSIDTPLENIEAMYQAFRKYGEYQWTARS